MTKDRVTGFISAVLGIAVAIGAYNLPASKMENDIGPAVFPYITAFILVFCGVGLFLKKRNEDEKPFFTKEQLKRLLKVVGIMTAYLIAESLIGYLIPTIIVVMVMCMMFAKKGQLAWWKAAVFSVFFSLTVFAVFEKLFVLLLPQGIIL